MAGAIKFYWLVIKRALYPSFWGSEKWFGALAILTSVAAYFLKTLGIDENKVPGDVPAWIFAVLFGAALAGKLLAAPYHLWREEREKADILAKRQEPKLRVSVTSEELVMVVSGDTSQTGDGGRFTVELDRRYMAVLSCSNVGLQTAEACCCSLLGIWRHVDGHWVRLPLCETIALSWTRDIDVPEFVATINPNETRLVYLASLYPQGHAWLHRRPKDLPVEYHKLLAGPGRYRLLVQLKSKDPDPLHVLIELETRKAEHELGKLPKSEGRVTILEQGVPPLSRASIGS